MGEKENSVMAADRASSPSPASAKGLLPCPFCGAVWSEDAEPPGVVFNYSPFQVTCMNCVDDDGSVRVERWNTRPAEDFYENGVRLDFMRALEREEVAITKMIEAGLIRDREEWFKSIKASEFE